MTSAATEPPGAENRSGKRGRRLAGLAAGMVLAVGIASGFWAWLRARMPEPPLPDLAGALPEVAQAIKGARAAVTAEPGSPAAWGRLGMVLHAHDYLAEAQRAYAQAGTLAPRDPRWPYLEALARLKDPADPAPALPLLQRAVALAGNEPAPRLRLGEALLEQGQLDEAESQFRRALERHPRDARALLGLGQVAHFRGDLARSRDYLTRSALYAPGVLATHALLAELHHRLGDEQAAQEERRRLAQCSAESNWPDPYLAEVERCGTGILPAIKQASDLFQRGRGSAAVELLKQTVARHPDALLASLALGRFCNQLGQAAEAERALRQAVRLQPDSFEAHFELGIALQIQGCYPAAAACYRQTAALKPDYAPAHYRLGHCLARQGDRAGALEAFRAAVRYRPNFAACHKDLGCLLAENGTVAEAVVHLHHALGLNPADPQARSVLARLLGQLPVPIGP